MSNNSKFSRTELIAKAEKYCAYQDRSEKEVVQRLKRWDANNQTVNEVISHLRELSFLDDERFAESYVRGKFRMNKWGRMKIRRGLWEKGVAESIAERALETIPKQEYKETCEELIMKYRSKNKSLSEWEFRGKLMRFLTGKGFEPEVVNTTLDSLKSNNQSF